MIGDIKKIIDSILYIYENLDSPVLKYLLIKRLLNKYNNHNLELPEEIKKFLNTMKAYDKD
ncbi:hypothetical protein [Methanocaldococcus sp.]